MRTVSLRRRVTLVALAVLVLALVVFDAFLYISLDARLRADLRGRLTDRARLGAELYPQSSGRQLADRLTGDGITAAVSSEGQTVIGRPSPLPAQRLPLTLLGGHPPKGKRIAPAPVTAHGSVLTLTEPLPGATVRLTADGSTISVALARLLVLEAIGSLANPCRRCRSAQVGAG